MCRCISLLSSLLLALLLCASARGTATPCDEPGTTPSPECIAWKLQHIASRTSPGSDAQLVLSSHAHSVGGSAPSPTGALLAVARTYHGNEQEAVSSTDTEGHLVAMHEWDKMFRRMRTVWRGLRGEEAWANFARYMQRNFARF